ncbi:hypothetical protein LSAT2_002786 [Lamellibrachia satsuma]|nr:hypothetical protein LSAT2_002786 [Lamellibrachia satsuma]
MIRLDRRLIAFASVCGLRLGSQDGRNRERWTTANFIKAMSSQQNECSFASNGIPGVNLFARVIGARTSSRRVAALEVSMAIVG